MSKDFYLPVPLHVELLPLTETAASELTPCRDAETFGTVLGGYNVKNLSRLFAVMAPFS